MERHSVKYDCCPEHYVDVTVTLRIQRRALYFYFNLVLPCGIISAMALVVFTLPVECGEKMGLSVTIVLSLTVFMMVVAETVPRTSDAVPLLGIYFSCIMLISAFSLVVSSTSTLLSNTCSCSFACSYVHVHVHYMLTAAWVVNLHHYPYVTEPPPDWVRCLGLTSRASTTLIKRRTIVNTYT